MAARSPSIGSARRARALDLLLAAITSLIVSTGVLNVHLFRLDRNFGEATAAGDASDCRQSLPAIGAKSKGRPIEGRSIADEDAERNAKILVVYAGPTNKAARLAELYRKNLDFFLEHGVECDTQDTVIAVGQHYYDEYVARIKAMDERCRHRVILVSRRDVCYDMEAARLAAYGGVPGIDVRSYDYFLFANCGTTGPAPRATLPGGGPWTSQFIDLLDDRVKMAGIVLNCEDAPDEHIMSMAYALDRTGLDVVLRAGAFFDCLDPERLHHPSDFINKYERKMGREILAAGHALRPIVGRDMVLTRGNRAECRPCTKEERDASPASCQERDRYGDIWIGSRLKAIYGGRTPRLNETIFFKTSRVFPDEIAELVGWNRSIPINWQWN